MAVPVTMQIDDVFDYVARLYPLVANALADVLEKDGGWSTEKSAERLGGYVTFMDAEGRVVRSDMVGNPSASWATETEEIARYKCRVVLETGDATIDHVNVEQGVYAGGIPVEYICPHTGEEKVGALAFSGLPQYADHALVICGAFYARMNFRRELLIDACANQNTATTVFNVQKGYATAA